MKLEGIIPATITPFNNNYKVDEKSLKKYIKWLLGFKELGGLAVNMDTGEGPHLSPEEKRKIIKIYSETIKGKYPLIAGISARYTEEAVLQAKDAKESGADAIVIFPIQAFSEKPLPLEIPLLYHKAIAKACNLPIVLFQLQPTLGGAIFEDKTIENLISIKNVIAIKEASFDTKIFIKTRDLVRKTEKKIKKKISLLSGNDNFIYESFILGADGALIGFGTIAIQEQINMFKLAKEGKYTEAEKINNKKIQPLANVIFASPVRDYRARLKEALKMLGVIDNAIMRPPLIQVSKEEKEKIRQILKETKVSS